MHAVAQDLGHLLGSRDQYVIPRFQRYYEWESINREKLWDDLVEVAFDDQRDARHFFGAIVAIPTGHQMGQVTPYLVIDGQQRLTTVSLLLVALRDVSKARGHVAEAERVEDLFIVHKHEVGNERYRLLLRQKDRTAYLQLVDGKPPVADSNLGEAYSDLRQKVEELVSAQPDDLETLRKLIQGATSRFNVVSITLKDENPFQIFKSLNSTGLQLAEADLVRNHVFMNVPLDEVAQGRFEQDHWDPLERVLQNISLDPTMFYRHFLMRNGAYVKDDGVYAAFESEWSASNPTPEAKTSEMKWFAELYRVILGIDKEAPGSPLQGALGGLGVLRRFGTTTAYPLVMNLAARVRKGSCSREEFKGCIWALNSFVLRRYVCQEGSRAYSKWLVAGIPGQTDPALATLKGFLGGKGWPSDARFQEALKSFNLYAGDNSPYAREVLTRLVRSAEPKDERADLSGCEIEHVLPQTVNPGTVEGDAWIAALGGPGWEQAYWRTVNTLGNLTLVGKAYNRSVKNLPFAVKKPELVKSIVVMNRHFSDVGDWTESAITSRSAMLGEELCKIFPGP
jgi:hypothetical protein